MNNCLPIKKNIFKEGTLLGVIQPHSAKQIKTPNWQIFARGVFPQSSRKKKTPNCLDHSKHPRHVPKIWWLCRILTTTVLMFKQLDPIKRLYNQQLTTTVGFKKTSSISVGLNIYIYTYMRIY